MINNSCKEIMKEHDEAKFICKTARSHGRRYSRAGLDCCTSFGYMYVQKWGSGVGLGLHSLASYTVFIVIEMEILENIWAYLRKPHYNCSCSCQ